MTATTRYETEREPRHDGTREVDVLVIGAGFGGLAAALALAERGARVMICERLRYPGGCASTFEKEGYAFDAGATLLSGLGPTQFFGELIGRHELPVDLDWPDPVIELRTRSLALDVPRSRAALVERFATMPGAPGDSIRRFFALQARVAETLWPLLDDPTMLPPFDFRMFARHAKRGLDYASIASLVGRPLGAMLAAHGLERFEPLRVYADALCQITVQCSAAEAEAPIALSAMDYAFRGAAHVRGGVGKLAWAMLDAAWSVGAKVRLADRVVSVRPDDGGYVVETRSGTVRARAVVANLLPAALGAMLVDARLDAATRRLGQEVEDAYSAVMLFFGVRPDEQPASRHLQLVADPARPFEDGNHVFVSISGGDEERGPGGLRAVTASTHVRLAAYRDRTSREIAEHTERVQTNMALTIAELAPKLWETRDLVFPASPRTFERFIGRPRGAVGGLPRRAGIGNYRRLGPTQPLPKLFLVGDSTFPGQSALAAAIGGHRTAVAVSRALGDATHARLGR